MSSIMNDIDKVQVATSHILADLLRQIFAAGAALRVVIGTNWTLVSLIVLLVRHDPDTRIGRASAAPAAARRSGRPS
jgi:hypothetical protein